MLARLRAHRRASISLERSDRRLAARSPGQDAQSAERGTRTGVAELSTRHPNQLGYSGLEISLIEFRKLKNPPESKFSGSGELRKCAQVRARARTCAHSRARLSLAKSLGDPPGKPNPYLNPSKMKLLCSKSQIVYSYPRPRFWLRRSARRCAHSRALPRTRELWRGSAFWLLAGCAKCGARDSNRCR